MSNIDQNTPQNFFDRFEMTDLVDQNLQATKIPVTSSRTAWLRRWEVLVYESDDVTTIPAVGESPAIKQTSKAVVLSNSDYGASALRVVFDVYCVGHAAAWWYGDVEIYNLDAKITEKLLTKDMRVIINAGYQNAHFGEIFNGRILTPSWEREAGVNFKMSLHCVAGMPLVGSNVVNKSRGPQATQRDIIAHIAENAMNEITIKSISNDLDNTVKLPRGQTYFGNPTRYFDQIAAANSLQHWTEEDGFSMGPEKDDPANQFNPQTQAIVYTPETGIVGTPVATQDGISMRVLLDNRLRVRTHMQRVMIDNSSIRAWKTQIGQYPSILDRDGIYFVKSVHHLGDTRGTPWYTDIVGTTRILDALLAHQSS